jgi:DNA topoisomerase-2
MLETLNADWQKLENKVRFITEIIEGTLVVSNRKKADLLSELKKRGYATFVKGKMGEEDEEGTGGYDYLFSMSIWNLTMDKVEALVRDKEAKQVELEALSKQSAKDLWRTDLDVFLAKWEEFEEMMYDLENQVNPKIKGGKGKAKKVMDGSDSECDFEVKKPKGMRVSGLMYVAAPKKAAVKKAAVKIEVDPVIEITKAVKEIKIDKKRVVRKKVEKVAVESDDSDVESPVQAKSKKEAVMSSDEDIEDDSPVKKKAVAKFAAPFKKKVFVLSSDSEDEKEDATAMKVDSPIKKKVVTKVTSKVAAPSKSKKAVVLSSEDESEMEVSDSEMEEDSPVKKKVAAPAKSKKAEVLSSEDEMEEDSPVKKKPVAKVSAPKPAAKKIAPKTVASKKKLVLSSDSEVESAPVPSSSKTVVVDDDDVDVGLIVPKGKRGGAVKSAYVYESDGDESEESVSEEEDEGSFGDEDSEEE